MGSKCDARAAPETLSKKGSHLRGDRVDAPGLWPELSEPVLPELIWVVLPL